MQLLFTKSNYWSKLDEINRNLYAPRSMFSVYFSHQRKSNLNSLKNKEFSLKVTSKMFCLNVVPYTYLNLKTEFVFNLKRFAMNQKLRQQ